MKYSIFAILREGLRGGKGWAPAWREPEPKAHYDVVIVGEVAGPRARDVLAKGIAIDLDASAFKIGDAAQTSAAHIGLQIALIDETPTFEIISARSTAGNFWSWLVTSAAEYGIEVA